MKKKNINTGMPIRMVELLPWVKALDAWKYCNPEPLAELINSETLPVEIAPAIAEIVSGKRKPNANGAAKLQTDHELKFEIAFWIRYQYDLIERKRIDALSNKNKDVSDQADLEPIEIKRRAQAEYRKVKQDAAYAYDVSYETIQKIIKAYGDKAKAWPVV